MPPDLVQRQAHEHQGTRSSSGAKNSTKPGMLLPRPCTCLYDDREVADAAAPCHEPGQHGSRVLLLPPHHQAPSKVELDAAPDIAAGAHDSPPAAHACQACSFGKRHGTEDCRQLGIAQVVQARGAAASHDV